MLAYTQEQLSHLASRVSVHVKQGATASDYVENCTTEAHDLVLAHVGNSKVPERVFERAIVEVAADLYYRRNAVNGLAQFDNGETLDVLRIGQDPLRPARAMLKPFLGVPLA